MASKHLYEGNLGKVCQLQSTVASENWCMA